MASDDFDPYYKWLGIPPEEQPPDYYRLLAIAPFESDHDVVQNAVDRLLRSHIRSFSGGEHEAFAQQILSELSAAKSCLLHPATKGRYDQGLRQKLDSTRNLHANFLPPSAAASPPPFPRSYDQTPSAESPLVENIQRPAAPAAEANPLDFMGDHFAPADDFTGAIDGGAADFTGGEGPASSHGFAGGGGGSPSGIKRGRAAAGAQPAGGAAAGKPKPGGVTNGYAIYLALIFGVGVTGIVMALIFKSRIEQKAAEEDKPPPAVVKTAPPKNPGDPVKVVGVGGTKSPNESSRPHERPAQPDDPPDLVDVEKSTDLLAHVDPLRNAVEHKDPWIRTGSAISSPSIAKAHLQIPFIPPEEYDLTLHGSRQVGTGELVINLPTSVKPIMVTLDGGKGNAETSFFKTGARAPVGHLTYKGALLAASRPVTILIKVRKNKLSVSVDDAEVLSANSFLKSLDVPSSWRPPSSVGSNVFFLGAANTVFSFDKIQLDPVIKGSAGATPDTSPSEPSTPEPSAAVAKTAPPTAEQITKSQGELKELFSDDFKRLKTPEDRFKLAESIYAKGIETNDSPVDRYAAILLACDMGAKLGRWTAVLQAVDELDKNYTIDPWEMKAAKLESAIEPTLPSEAANSLERVLHGIDAGVGRSDFALAGRYLALAMIAAHAIKDKDTTTMVQSRSKELKSLEQQFAAAKVALDILKQDPTNAKAGSEAGRWFCFARGEWTKGLPLLAQGDDPALKQLAKQDLARPTAAEGQLQVADGWWDRGEGESDTLLKKNLQLHASDLYRQALPTATGLAKVKIEKRLADLDKVTDTRPASISLTRLEPVSAKAYHEAMGPNKIVNSPGSKTPVAVTKGERACTDFIFAHANSELVYNIPEGMKEFQATGYSVNSQNVKFSVWIDGTKLYESPPAGIHSMKVTFNLGAKQIKLICHVTGDQKSCDSFWCYPKFFR